MSETFTIKRGDTSPAIQWELEDPEINLEGASVVFNMQRASNGVPVVARGVAEVVSDADRPTLRYNWAATVGDVPGDTAVAGLYKAEFEITFADGSVETTPNNANIVVYVLDDLG